MENICVKQPLERKYQGKIRLDYHHRLEKVGGEMVVHRCKALQTIPFATHCSDCISYGKTLHRVTINFHDGFQRLASAVRGNYWARRKMCPVVRRYPAVRAVEWRFLLFEIYPNCEYRPEFGATLLIQYSMACYSIHLIEILIVVSMCRLYIYPISVSVWKYFAKKNDWLRHFQFGVIFYKYLNAMEPKKFIFAPDPSCSCSN